MQPAKFQEEFSAKIPALALLANLGYEYLSVQAASDLRGSPSSVVLTPILKQQLACRRFQFHGKERTLSDKALDALIREIATPALNEGLEAANERFYDQLMYGISVTDFIDGDKANPTIALIDWYNLENNCFQFTEELKVSCHSGVGHRIPDIVLYVNGLPLVVIEAKRPSGNTNMLQQGVSQMLGNQQPNKIPQLFAFSQVLLSVDGHEGLYGTVGTKPKFWTSWKEEISEEDFFKLKNTPLTPATEHAIFATRPDDFLSWYKNWFAGGLMPSGQDKLIGSLCRPDRLLEMIRFYIFNDHRFGKIIARYPQVFGMRALMNRVQKKDGHGARAGGVIWHTTGSGKSFTMVMLTRALVLYPKLKNCRVLVVTDRTDLEKQISKTFAASGVLSTRDKENALATSGRDLAMRIGKGSERVVFSLVQKFLSAATLPECFNDSADMIVLVDEGHRSQGGENYNQMRQALPNAAFVAFTGTPLLKKDQTQKNFGSIIHAYTMQRATEDKSVTPLLYEERRLEIDVNDKAIDSWFERITAGLTKEQQADLKRKFARKGEIYQTDSRLELIAHDISDHFSKNIPQALKGQVACDSRLSAIRLKHFLDEIGLVSSRLVMSAPDSREGNVSADEEDKGAIQKWWDKNVGKEDASVYKQDAINAFSLEGEPQLLIVVDQLLTGFDEPRNAVLYIDKNLKQHNLIQAIARVNRLHEDKEFGLLIAYRAVLSELDTTIASYQDLATRTQGGYNIDDIEDLYRPMSSEYKKLPTLYIQLWDIFSEVKHKQDIEQLLSVLIPKMQEIDGKMVDTHQKIRDDFYLALSQFASTLKIALQSASFFADQSFSAATKERYKETVKQLSNLRQKVRQASGESVDYDYYDAKIRKLMEQHVSALSVKESEGIYHVNALGNQLPNGWSDEKTKNEKDIIQTRVTRQIEQLLEDPYAQKAFSELLREVIAEADALFDHPLKQYLLFQDFEKKVLARQMDEMPAVFGNNIRAQSYFGVFKLVLAERYTMIMEQDAQLQNWIDLAFKIDERVNNALEEFSISPQNFEAEIRKQLLPECLTCCKNIGLGIEQTKAIVEEVIQIAQVRFKK